jgi:hypothetical protein
MDLRIYYQKIREVEAKIDDVFPVVISLATADGGKAGVCSEVPRRLAAKLVVEGLAKLASSEEAEAFRKENAEAARRAEENAAAQKVQVVVVPAAAMEKPGNPKRAQA